MIDLKPYIDQYTGLVPLTFTKRYKNINAGETAGFKPADAQALLDHKDEPCVLFDKSAGKPAPSAPKAKPGEREPKPSTAKVDEKK